MANKKDKMTIDGLATKFDELAVVVKGAIKTNEKSIEDLAGMIQRNMPTKDEMNAKFDEFRVEIKSEIGGLRNELKDEIWGARTELKNEIQEVKIELEEVHDIVRRIDEKDLPNLKRRVTSLETIIKPLRK